MGVVPDGPAVSRARPTGENILIGVLVRLAGAEPGVEGRGRLGDAGLSLLAELVRFLAPSFLPTFLGTPTMDTRLSGTANVGPGVGGW